MKKTFIGNEDAYKQLTGYLDMKHPGPLILYGKKGLGKRMAAEETASAILGCGREELGHNVDFYLLDKQNDPVRVEDILTLLEKSSIAALGTCKVCLICHAEKMNVQAQNKLLKLLEDRNRTNIVILLCERGTLLDTIKSRCLTISFFPLSDKEMASYLATESVPAKDSGLAGFICGNCPYHWTEVSAYFPDLSKLSQQIKNIREKKELFAIFHLVREKDADEFYAAHSGHYTEALSMIQYLFYTLMTAKAAPKADTGAADDFGNLADIYTMRGLYTVCTEIAKHQKQWLTGAYSKNDFFDLVRCMVQS